MLQGALSKSSLNPVDSRPTAAGPPYDFAHGCVLPQHIGGPLVSVGRSLRAMSCDIFYSDFDGLGCYPFSRRKELQSMGIWIVQGQSRLA